MSRVFLLFIAGCCLLLASIPTPAAAEELTRIRFTLDWRYEGHLSFFMMAKARGYFEKEGIDFTLDSGAGSGASINRVVAGSHDMGAADMSSLIEYAGNNPDKLNLQAVYLLYSRSPFIIQTLQRSGIRKPQDLAGKRMASPVYDSSRKAFPIYARAIGIDPASVTWLNVDAALRETMLAKGEVDAIPGFELDRLTLIGRGVPEGDIVTFSYADAGLKLYGNVVLASNKLINENPKAVAGALRAINRALIEAVADPAASAAYTKQFDPLTDEKVALQKLLINLRVIDTPFARANGLGGLDMGDLRNQIDEVTRTSNLKSKPSAEALFNASFLPPAADRMLPAKR